MELHEFITTTLSEIQLGVQNAINYARDNGVRGAINPVWGSAGDAGPSHVREVEFDIAVTITRTNDGGVGGGIKVAGLAFGAGKNAHADTGHISRIRFAIPIIQPVTTVRDAPSSG